MNNFNNKITDDLQNVTGIGDTKLLEKMFGGNHFFGSHGWICPVCGRVYSPYTISCPYCGKKDVEIVTKSNTNSL